MTTTRECMTQSREKTIVWLVAALLVTPSTGGAQQLRPASAIVMTPATFSVLNPSVFGDNAPAVLGGDYGHRPDAKSYLFSGSLSHFRFQFGRTFFPQGSVAKFLMTGVDYAHGVRSLALTPSLSVVSGMQASAGYGVTNWLNGTGDQGWTVGMLAPIGARFANQIFEVTPYVAPGYFYARTAETHLCGVQSQGQLLESCSGFSDYAYLFSFGGGVRLDLLNRLSLEAGIRKTHTPQAISRRSFGMSYRVGNLEGRGLRDAGTFTLEMDNDFLGRGYHGYLDQDYTQGFHWSSNRKRPIALTTRALSTFGRCAAEDDCETRSVLLAGQEIYTPRYYPTLAPDDRPFAGWLYAGAQSNAESPSDQTSVGLKVGVTGPPSLARQLQVSFHQLFPGYAIPPGWDNQLRFEPGLIATVARKNWSAVHAGLASVGVIKSGSASVGNILTDAEVGLALRAGMNAPHPWSADSKQVSLGAYASFGGRADLVLHNFFVDGNTFRSGPRVQRVPYVFQRESIVGLCLGAYSVEYRSILRSQEFESGRSNQPYGTISLTRRGAY